MTEIIQAYVAVSILAMKIRSLQQFTLNNTQLNLSFKLTGGDELGITGKSAQEPDILKFQYIFVMNPFRIFKTLIHNADFFSTTQLIRYQEEPEFKTFTGGIFSLIIVGVIAAIFFSMSLKTLNKENIYWSSQIIKQSEPDPITISFMEKQIGIQLQGFNLTASKQFFDITLSLFSYYNKDPNPVITTYPLEACKRQNWNYNAEILGNFDKMHGQNWLCPPLNSTFTIMGKYTSSDYAYLSFDIMKCGSVKSNVTCASDSQIDAVLANQVYFSIYFINSLITADQAQPVKYYLEDKDYIAFGKNIGAYGYIYISDYSIATDQSILPYSAVNTTNGDIVVVPTSISVQETTANWFSSFVFLKSTNRYEYTRSFTKFDTVISYTGGLFGAIIGILFLMNHYTRLSFELVLGSHMYNDDNNQPMRIKSLNFFRYIGFTIYGLLQSLGCNTNWKIYQGYQKCRDEIQKHLDIRFILEKLIFLQRSIHSICGQDKYKTLHLKSKCTISEAKKFREFYFLKSTIVNSISKRFKDIQAESAFEKSKNEKNELKIQKIAAEHLGKRISDRIRNGKVFPIEIQSDLDQIEPSGKPFRDEIRQGQRSRSKIMKTMKYTLTCIEEKEENNSSELPSQFQYKLDEDLMKSLAQVKKEADSGDITSLAIWSSIEDDIRLIIEECIYEREENNSFMPHEDHGNSQNQMTYPSKKRGKVQFC